MEIIASSALALALGLTVLWFATRSAITLCLLEIENGKLRIASGALSPRVLDDFRDIVKKPRVVAATIRVLRAKDHPRIEVRGNVSAAQLQQLRNVVGTIELAKLASSGRKKR